MVEIIGEDWHVCGVDWQMCNEASEGKETREVFVMARVQSWKSRFGEMGGEENNMDLLWIFQEMYLIESRNNK